MTRTAVHGVARTWLPLHPLAVVLFLGDGSRDVHGMHATTRVHARKSTTSEQLRATRAGRRVVPCGTARYRLPLSLPRRRLQERGFVAGRWPGE
jgi:hypothetical protein